MLGWRTVSAVAYCKTPVRDTAVFGPYLIELSHDSEGDEDGDEEEGDDPARWPDADSCL